MLNTTPKHILYIEPYKWEKSLEPNEDHLTQSMERMLKNATPESFWRGFHITDCGQRSDCCDFRIKGGYITNSLAAFYLRWYRNSISERDLNIVKELAGVDVSLPT